MPPPHGPPGTRSYSTGLAFSASTTAGPPAADTAASGGTGTDGRGNFCGGSDAGRQAIFDRVDADRDGVLSQPEFADAGRQDFACADRDGDGTVTLWEFYAATRL